MTARTLYSLRTTANGYILAKFEDGVTFDHQATYTINRDPSSDDGEYLCDCPSHKHPCKHIEMIVTFSKAEAADTDQFYDPKDGSWHTPLAPMGASEDAEELAQVLDEEDEANEFEIEPSLLVSESTNDEIAEAIEQVAAEPSMIEAHRPHPALGTIKRRI